MFFNYRQIILILCLLLCELISNCQGMNEIYFLLCLLFFPRKSVEVRKITRKRKLIRVLTAFNAHSLFDVFESEVI
mgnify:CR=1 FL=1